MYRPEPIGSDHVRRLHGMEYNFEKLSSNLQKILGIVKKIPSISGMGEVLKDVKQITSIKKILTGGELCSVFFVFLYIIRQISNL